MTCKDFIFFLKCNFNQISRIQHHMNRIKSVSYIMFIQSSSILVLQVVSSIDLIIFLFILNNIVKWKSKKIIVAVWNPIFQAIALITLLFKRGGGIVVIMVCTIIVYNHNRKRMNTIRKEWNMQKTMKLF